MRLRYALLAIAVGVLGTVSCQEDAEAFQQRQACSDYCSEASECLPAIDVAECYAQCIDTLDACLDSKLDEAVDQLAECSDADECVNIGQCSVQVSAVCISVT